MKRIFVLLLLSAFIYSCGKKLGGKSATEFTKSEFVGKRFTLKGYTPNPSRPEEGGVPFIKFDENNAEYLTGDILNIAKYQVKEGKIICNNEQFNKIVTFTIVDSKTLKDEFNGIWTLE